MSALALTLVLVAAVFHAAWNLAAKRVAGGASFVWVTGLVSTLLWTPLVLFFTWGHPTSFTPLAVGFIVLSGVLHAAYSLYLQRAYRSGDFSLVYPLARGTGPLLSALAAIIWLGERPTPLAGAGIGLIVAGIFLLTGGPALFRGHPHAGAIANGVLCGVFIAAYTFADQRAILYAGVSPLLIDWGGNLARTLLFAPAALARPAECRAHWRDHRREVLLVAVLGPAGYILVLFAMQLAPLSYVAPVREVSILLGAYAGARLFREPATRARLFATLGMVAGVIALALG